jgi:recombination DNA repair RAD52 pathway protein
MSFDFDSRGTFSAAQVGQLLKPINPSRVMQAQGHAHVSQQDITAHLIRMFGFGNFDIEVLKAELVFESEKVDAKGTLTGRYDVAYRGLVRLTVRNEHGHTVGVYENGSVGTAQNQYRGDGHDLAYKSAISLSVKRAAIALGDQFGLSLYNKGQLQPLVKLTLVGTTETPEDVQKDIPQQVSLGNDEIERA